MINIKDVLGIYLFPLINIHAMHPVQFHLYFSRE